MLTRFGLKRSTLLTFASTLLTVAFLALPAGGQAVQVVTLSTVADTTLLVPGSTTDTFTQLPPNPCISYGNDAFFGVGSGGEQGIYASLGGTLTRVADLNTGIPGGTGNFTAFSPSPFSAAITSRSIAETQASRASTGASRPTHALPWWTQTRLFPAAAATSQGLEAGWGLGRPR